MTGSQGVGVTLVVLLAVGFLRFVCDSWGEAVTVLAILLAGALAVLLTGSSIALITGDLTL